MAVALGLGRRPLPPRLATGAMTVVAAVAAGTVAVTVAATAVGFVLGPARRAELVEWCRIVPLHHEVGTIEGITSLAVLSVVIVRIGLVSHRRRTATRGTGGRRLRVLDIREPLAYAAPGKPGCVVVSTGLLAALEPRERQVVFAHERAHLRQRHHRYLLVAALAVAVVPLLRPLADRIRLATERSADEEAAATLGDRHLVATAIAKAALTRSAFGAVVPAFNGGSVTARVEALVGPGPSTWSTGLGLAAIVATTTTALGAGSLQLHHLWVLIDHVCHG